MSMEVDVYADLLFLINAGMDGLCFCLTGRLLHRKLSLWRVLLGSVIGGAYAVIALFFETGQAWTLIRDAGVCLVLCAIVFLHLRSPGGLRQCLSAAAVYTVLSMLLGGIMTALYNLFNRIGLQDILPAGEEGLGAWLFALLACVGSMITLSGSRFFSKASTIRPCRVTVELDGRSRDFEGMIDTGNLLRDPMSGRLVICIARNLLVKLLSPELARALTDSQSITSIPLSPSDARRLRLIPAGTATGRGILPGFVPDGIRITYTLKGKTQERIVQAVIASSEITATEAIVPAELLH